MKIYIVAHIPPKATLVSALQQGQESLLEDLGANDGIRRDDAAISHKAISLFDSKHDTGEEDTQVTLTPMYKLVPSILISKGALLPKLPLQAM